MFRPAHCGLYFTEEHIHRAQKHRQRPPLTAAWEYLDLTRATDDLMLAQLGGLRYRFGEELDAGEQALTVLGADLSPLFDDHAPYWRNIATALTLAQCFELLRDHPACSPDQVTGWLAALRKWVSALNRDEAGITVVDRCWLAALNIAAGIGLEDEAVFEAGAESYRQIVSTGIHPEGYLPQAVEDTGDDGLLLQVLAVAALVLAAEAAAHAGVDLWGYQQRGVSALTAATYPLYYYFYPERWPWNSTRKDDPGGLPAETATMIFRRHGGFLEIVNRRYERPLKAVGMILGDIRPVYDLYGGGLTTLSHAEPERRGLFGR
jgi:hypothetical protein